MQVSELLEGGAGTGIVHPRTLSVGDDHRWELGRYT